MKSRQRATDQADDVADFESDGRGDKDDEAGKPTGVSSVQKLLLIICSEYMFYAGAWVLSLWVLYQLSQSRTTARLVRDELHSSWARLVESDGANESALVGAYLHTMGESHFDYEIAGIDALPGSDKMHGLGDLTIPTAHPVPLVPPPWAPPPPAPYDARTRTEAAPLALAARSAWISATAPPVPPQLSAVPASRPASSLRLRGLHPRKHAFNTADPMLPLQSDQKSAEGTPQQPVRASMRPSTARGFEATGQRSPPIAAAKASESAEEALCRTSKAEHGVQPGKSWGSLPNKEKNEWMARRCDRFFCEPNKMEGRGVYACRPI